MLKLSIIVSKKNNLSQHIVGPGGLVKTVVHMRACVCVSLLGTEVFKSTFTRSILNTCSHLCNAVTQQPTLESLFNFAVLGLSCNWLNVPSQPAKVMKFIILCKPAHLAGWRA